MIKPFHLGSSGVIINLSTNVCDTELKVLQSDGFDKVLRAYLKSITKKSSNDAYLIKSLSTPKKIIEIYTLLLVLPYEEVSKKNEHLREILKQRLALVHFTEKLYDFWRRIERYGIINKKMRSLATENDSLIEASERFSRVILRLYRTITQNVVGHHYQVYRQIAAGLNASLITSSNKWRLPKGYEILEGIDFIDTVLIRTPFMGYSKSNTRSGLFEEIKVNPLSKQKITARHWLCYPIKVGPLLAYVYFHRDFIHLGVALSNLFEPALEEEYTNKSPQLIYLFGTSYEEQDCTFYHDKKNDIYIGSASRNEKNDYFGYLKKMLLTLHNVYMINHNGLPIHGAMVNIVLKNDVEKNIVVIGDSGAGKSETLEALRVIGSNYIKEMRIVFDDMGTFLQEDNKLYAIGTEIGAFIRLDDLENGYAYREIDRAVFLNPDKVNARVILPVADYATIMKHQKIDMVLYANNYVDSDQGIALFDDLDSALTVFREGARKAKGTTSEIGLVKSYFANPFGPVQRQKETEVLLIDYFNKLFEAKTPVGEIYTRLAVPGQELSGPQTAAKKLLEYLLHEI